MNNSRVIILGKPKPAKNQESQNATSRTSQNIIRKSSDKPYVKLTPLPNDGWADIVDADLLHPHYNLRRNPRTASLDRHQQAKSSAIATQFSNVMDSAGTSTGTVNIPTHNSYELLDDLDGADTESQSMPTQTRTKVRVPPIHIIGLQINEIFHKLSAAGISPNESCPYLLKHTKRSVQFLTKSKEVFAKTVAALKAANVQFFTHDTSENACTKFVLSGLPVVEIEDLKAELDANEIRPHDIRMLSSSKSAGEQQALYLLYFLRGTTKLQELRKTKALFSVVVSWRFFVKRPDDAAQCHRCQGFGHGSSNCNIPPKCVKCGGKHLTNMCPLPKKAQLTDKNNNKSQIKCANCGANHTANFRNCPARKSYLQELEKRKKKPSAPSPQMTNISFPGLAGASASSTNRSTRQSSGQNSYAQVLSTLRDVTSTPGDESTRDNLFTISEFLCLARDMFIRLSGCRTRQQQFLALSELMMKYLYHG